MQQSDLNIGEPEVGFDLRRQQRHQLAVEHREEVKDRKNDHREPADEPSAQEVVKVSGRGRVRLQTLEAPRAALKRGSFF